MNFLLTVMPGHVAQLLGHLTRKSEVLGSIPGLANILLFLLRQIEEGQLSVTGEFANLQKLLSPRCRE